MLFSKAVSQNKFWNNEFSRCFRSVKMQGAEIEDEGAYWSMRLSPNIESNAAVGHLWDTAEFGRFSCSSANFSSEAGAVLIFFCFVFLYQDKKMKWGSGRDKIKKPSNKYLCLRASLFKKTAVIYSPTVCSTIDVTGLNFSVRNGKRWNPGVITTWISFEWIIYNEEYF